MGPRLPLSKSELEVARIVWKLKRATVRQVRELLAVSRDVEYNTVQTFLNRLEAKGYLSSAREGRSLVYAPSARPRGIIRDTVSEFVGRLFDGDPIPLLEYLIQDRSLDEADLARLRALIEKREQAQHGDEHA